ncbi:MAG: hypothetical protein Q8R90_01505 [Bacteroidales bacterium]|nr:hypothetical protein [Bacteroidales bacterium]
MKKFLLLFASLICLIGVAAAQDVVGSALKVPSTYDRSSLTYLVLDYPSANHFNFVRNNVGKIAFSDKFYNNNLPNFFIPAPYAKDYIGFNKAQLILEAIQKKRVANDIVAKWYSMNSDGMMTLDLIHSRGMFNATDEAYLQSKTTKRGNAQLEDYGNRLIDRSYIVVIDYYDIKTMQEANVKDSRGWKSGFQAYLYKIDYNEGIQNLIYDNWIYEDDTPAVKADKRAALKKLEIPVVFVKNVMLSATESESTKSSTINVLGSKKPRTEDELMAAVLQKSYDEVLYNLEMGVEHFKVVTSIFAVRPIRAKIGKKEGIKTDNRYFAYEYVYDQERDITQQKFRGVIRATKKIADNVHVATGKSPTTEFYQTSGRKMETGYLLQQKNDFGAELSVGFEVGEIGGIYGRLDLRLGRYIGSRALFVLLEGGYESKNYGFDYKFTRYGVGVAKGLQLTRNSELRPYISLGIEETKNPNDLKLSTVYYKGGATLNINIKHNIQIFGGAGYYITGSGKDANGLDIGDWDSKFTDRSGLSFIGGLKLGF